MSEHWPSSTQRLLKEVAVLPATAVVERIQSIVSDHDRWRDKECLNLNPAESCLSAVARNLLASDMASRLAEGFPGNRLYPRGPQNRFADEIEAIVISLAMKLFRARFVEWRPVSTSMANAAAYLSLLRPGDSVIAQTEDGGGNYSYQPGGLLGLMGVRVYGAPHARTGAFEIDFDGVARLARNVRPRMIIIGGSNVMAPYAIAELRAIADHYEATLLFDAAHLGLLIAHGEYQDPLQEGAHLMTVSTHKVLGGPVGGLLLTNDASIAAKASHATFPALLQTRDQNKFAALAVSLADALVSGAELARQMRANARCLAGCLAEVGLPTPSGAVTATHQIFVQIGAGADNFEAACQETGILLASCMLEDDASLDRRTGLRLATHEVTRRGMREAEMRRVAELIVEAGSGTRLPRAIATDVQALLAGFPAT